MKGYTLQSYFKSLCNTYCIALKEKRRIEEKSCKLERYDPTNELMRIQSLLKLDLTEEMIKKYMSPNFSKEELKTEEEKLQKEAERYTKKRAEYSSQILIWKERVSCLKEEITYVIQLLENVIVITKEEVIVFIEFFQEKGFNENKINTDEQYLQSFPKDEISEQFLEIYLCQNSEKLKELYETIFN